MPLRTIRPRVSRALVALLASPLIALSGQQPATEGTPPIPTFDKTETMVAMRDGVKLHTIILIPKGARKAPMLLTRTPYNAKDLTSHAHSPHLGPILQGYDNAVDVIVDGGYIRVVQDIRGKYGSEGDYVMNRPLSGPQKEAIRAFLAHSLDVESSKFVQDHARRALEYVSTFC